MTLDVAIGWTCIAAMVTGLIWMIEARAEQKKRRRRASEFDDARARYRLALELARSTGAARLRERRANRRAS